MDALAPFEGCWQLIREVEDRYAEEILRFEGEATLSRDEQGLTYHESGIWTDAPFGRLAAERRYLWRLDGDRIAVHFEDGRPFHDFSPERASDASHRCDPDDYAVNYRFAFPDEWQAEWTVRGPRKDYTSRTCYRR